MNNELQRAIRLIRKTGDRIIIFDSENKQNGYVLMSLAEYERLALARNDVRGLTEEELLDKINRDIAIWRSEQEANVSQGQEMANQPAARPAGREKTADFSQDNFNSQVYPDYPEKAGFSEAASSGKHSPNRNKNVDFEGASGMGAEKSREEKEVKRGPDQRPGRWQIPPERKKGAEEIIEEERQYLEYIPF